MGELPDIFREVAQAIRNQYTITYKPTNTKQDGTYRKLKVELVGPDDKPLVIKDEKNKDVKYIDHRPRRLYRQARSGIAAASTPRPAFGISASRLF